MPRIQRFPNERRDDCREAYSSSGPTYQQLARSKRYGDLLGPRLTGSKIRRHGSQLESLEPAERLQGHKGCVNQVCWHPGGQILASVSDDRRALLWRYPQKWWDPSNSPASIPPGSSISSDTSDTGESDDEYEEDEEGAGMPSSYEDTNASTLAVAYPLSDTASNPLSVNLLGRWNFNMERRMESPLIPSDPAPVISQVSQLPMPPWDSMAHCYEVETEHTNNIFDVAFLPSNPITQVFASGDSLLTGGADAEVHRYSLETGQNLNTYKCHSGPIHNIITIFDSPYTWLTSSEDGTVRQFDCRQPHYCNDPGGCSNCLLNEGRSIAPLVVTQSGSNVPRDIRYLNRLLFALRGRQKYYFPTKQFCEDSPARHLCEPFDTHQVWMPRFPRRHKGRISSIAVNPIRSEVLLASTSDPIIRVLDRRMLSPCRSTETPNLLSTLGHTPLQSFCPPHIQYDPFNRLDRFVRCEAYFPDSIVCEQVYPTHVEWRADGKEFLASYSNECVYAFPFDNLLHEPNLAIEYQIPKIRKRVRSASLSAETETIIKEYCNRAEDAYEGEDYDAALRWYTIALEFAGPSLMEILQQLIDDDVNDPESKRDNVEASQADEPNSFAHLLIDIWRSLSDRRVPKESLLRVITPLMQYGVYGSQDSYMDSMLKRLRRYRAPLLCNRALVALKMPPLRLRGGYSMRRSNLLLAMFDCLEAAFLAPDSAKPYDRLVSVLLAREEYYMAIKVLTHLFATFTDARSRNMLKRHLKEGRKLLQRQQRRLEFVRARASLYVRPPGPVGPARRDWYRRQSQTQRSRDSTAEGEVTVNSPHRETTSSDHARRRSSDNTRDFEWASVVLKDRPKKVTAGSGGEFEEIGGLQSTRKATTKKHLDFELLQEASQRLLKCPISARERILLDKGQFDTSAFDTNPVIVDLPRALVSLKTSSSELLGIPKRLSDLKSGRIKTLWDRSPVRKPPYDWHNLAGSATEGQDLSDEEIETEISKILHVSIAGLKEERAVSELIVSASEEEADTSSTEDNSEDDQRADVISPPTLADYKQRDRLVESITSILRKKQWRPQVAYRRFTGSVNSKTDLKQVSYWDYDGIIGASEDGEVFVWRHKDGKLIRVLHGHACSVNCVRVHPTDAVLATSGVDDYVQLWRPLVL